MKNRRKMAELPLYGKCQWFETLKCLDLMGLNSSICSQFLYSAFLAFRVVAGVWRGRYYQLPNLDFYPELNSESGHVTKSGLS
jgi:hypothetical protein